MLNIHKRVPRYRRHKASGQAVVTIEGHDVYLGKYRSAGSREAYQRAIAEWLQGGRTCRRSATVVEVIAAYLRFATGYYRKDDKPTEELRITKDAVSIVYQLYGHTPAVEFGPLSLKACREQMISRDWCRSHINKQIGRIKRMFKWAAEEELIPGSVAQSLWSVAGLRVGRTTARESEPVLPIGDAIVEATLPHIPAVVADMVRLQRLTGMRPAELCLLRPCDVDRSDKVLKYRPGHHKTEHRGGERIVFIGPQAQEVLLRYLARHADIEV